MEEKKKKKKDHQINPSDPDINVVSLNPIVDEHHDKQDDNSKNQDGVEISGKKPRIISSPSKENNAYYQNPQNPPNYQCQPQIQLDADSHQTHQFQLPPPLVASIPPAFWLHHRPGYQTQGDHNIGSCYPFPQMGLFDSSWQVPSGNGMVTTSTHPSQSPSVFYQFGYQHPTFSGGPWGDPSSWCGQAQQCPPFCIYPFPGAFNYIPSPAPQPTTNCSTPSGQSSQKGVIEPSIKICQKHQLLWDTQSAENVQLWAAIAGLQTELADIRSRLSKFETEAKSLKSSEEQIAANSMGNTSTGLATKRGRSIKDVVASVDPLPSPHKPHPLRRAKRPTLSTSKGPLEIREINFRKDDKNKIEFIDAVSTLIPTYRHANGKKLTSMLRTGRNPSDVTPNFPSFYESQRNTIVPPNTSYEAKADEQVKKLEGNVFDQGNSKVVPWNNMVNESNNTSEDLDETTAESDKEEDDEDMYNVASTCIKGIHPVNNNEVPYGTNDLEDGNPRGFLSW